jgi:hypothetical protein
MMPILKRIGIGVGLATLLVVVVGFMLPATYSITRSVRITADPARIHALVGDLEQWPAWMPWVKADPTIRVTLGDRTSGEGAHQSWVGDSGGGELTFTRADPTWGIGYDMNFDEGKYQSHSTMEYRPAGPATEVVWIMTGDNGRNPFSRYFGLMMDPMVGPMFEEGLNRLKLAAETATPLADPEPTPAEGVAQ